MRPLFIFILAFAVALPASAQTSATIQAETTGSAQTSTSSEPQEASADYLLKIKGGEGESEKGGNVETEWKVEEGESAVDKATPQLMEANTKGSHDGDPDRPVVEGKVLQNNQSDLDFLRGNAVSMSAVEVRGWDPQQKQEFLATVKAHAEVQSEQDLENFATGVLLKDQNVEQITLNFEKVEMRYSMPAKFLGFIDSSVPVRTEVDTTGRVKVQFPWYGFLFRQYVNASELVADVEAALPEVNEEVLVSFENRAAVLLTLKEVLKTKHDVAMNAIRNMK